MPQNFKDTVLHLPLYKARVHQRGEQGHLLFMDRPPVPSQDAPGILCVGAPESNGPRCTKLHEPPHDTTKLT